MSPRDSAVQLVLALRGIGINSTHTRMLPFPDHHRTPIPSGCQTLRRHPADDPAVCPPTPAGQLGLFPPLRRHLTVEHLDRAALPALTEPAQQLITEFERHGHNQKWRGFSIAHNSRVLRILLAWLGATAPLHEIDVKAIARLQPGYNGLRVAQYLDTRGLLIPDPVSVVNSADTAVDRAISQLPHQFRTEITAWITVLQGQGRRRHQALLPTTIRRYVDHVIPALLDWSTRVDSL